MAKPKLTPREEILKKFPNLQIGIGGIARNPYSGQSVELSAEASALYELVKGAEIVYNYNPAKGYKDFRKGLDLFRKLFPDEYMVLLD